MEDLLKTLCSIDGASGYEENVAETIGKMVRRFADELMIDPLGNLTVFKHGRKRSKHPLLLCSHMDEMGFLVSQIMDSGILKLTSASTVDAQMLIGCRIRIRDGSVRGVMVPPPRNFPAIEENGRYSFSQSLYADIGTASKLESEAIVSVGDLAVFDSDFNSIGDCVKSKALDGRVGCSIMIKLLQQELACDTYFAFVGGGKSGAPMVKVVTGRIAPAAVLVLDTAAAVDFPTAHSVMQATRQRGGAVVSAVDSGAAYNRKFHNRMTAAADKKGITWQYCGNVDRDADIGPIDAALGGCPVLRLSVPARYMHSASGLVYMPDVEETFRFAELFIEEAGGMDV